jgi:hypothetical protein
MGTSHSGDRQAWDCADDGGRAGASNPEPAKAGPNDGDCGDVGLLGHLISVGHGRLLEVGEPRVDVDVALKADAHIGDIGLLQDFDHDLLC